MNKLDITKKLKNIKELDQDERSFLINLVNTKKKYGLVWEDKIENVE
jgi:adenine-specific DNA-methyltransferase